MEQNNPITSLNYWEHMKVKSRSVSVVFLTWMCVKRGTYCN